jgi:hypothetical protein
VACSLTYDGTLARVRVDATSLGGTAVTATVERSDDGGSTFAFIRGGTGVPVSGGATLLTTDDYEYTTGHQLTYRVRGQNSSGAQTASTTCTITVNQTKIWLKSVERPFLNRELDCVLNPSPINRDARGGVFEILGRSFPVAVTDVRGGLIVSLRTVTRTYEEQEGLDLLLASGDLLYLQSTATFPLTSMFVAVDRDVDESRPVRNRDCDDLRSFTLPLTQIEPLDDDVVGHTFSWYSVIVTYSTWSAVIADNATWADLLDQVAEPTEVIVP